MEQSTDETIKTILTKIKDLKLESCSVKKTNVADLSAYGRAHSL